MCYYNVKCRFQKLSSNLNYYVANDAYEFFVITYDGRIKWVLTTDGWKFRERSHDGQRIWHQKVRIKILFVSFYPSGGDK